MDRLSELYEYAEAEGIEVDDVPTRSIVSASFPEGFILLNTALIDTHADELERLAHELGHCSTGSFYNIYTPFDLRSRHEYRANAWAIKKLVPKDELKALYSVIDPDEEEIAGYFGVSVGFLHVAHEYYTTVVKA